MQLSKKKAFTGLLLCCFLFSAAAIGQSRVKRIAVFDFQSTGLKDKIESSWDVGKDVTSRIEFELVNNGTFEVVERSQLERVLKEQDHAKANRFDKETAVKLGRLVSASAVVLGVINRFNIENRGGGIAFMKSKRAIAQVELTARLVDTRNGKLIATAKGTGTAERTEGRVKRKNNDVFSVSSDNYQEALLGEAIAGAVTELVATLVASADEVQETVIEVKGVVVDVDGEMIGVDVGADCGLMQGDIVQVVQVDKEVKSPKTGKVLYERTSKIADLKLLEVGPDYAIGIVENQNGRAIKEGDRVRLPPSD